MDLDMSIIGENPAALEKALAMFEAAKNVEALPAEQRAMVAGAAIRHGKPGVPDKLMKEYVLADNPDVKDCITVALCSTRDKAVGQKVIDWAIGPKGVAKLQDIDHWFAYLIRNRHTRDLAWKWLTTSWDRLAKLFGGGKAMEFFAWYAAGPISTSEWEQRYHDFFEPMLDEPALRRNIQVGFGEISARVAWRQREEANLKAYLEKFDAT